MNHNKTGGDSIGGQVVFFLILLPASVCDLYCYKVPNAIICLGFFLSLYKNLWQYGVQGIGYFFLNCLIPFVVCFIFYLFHMFGAADIKLFSIISSYFNFKFCFRVMIVSLIIGAIFSIIKMFQKRNFIRRFRHFSEYIKSLAAGSRPGIYYDLKKSGDEGIIPFTICISLAVIICMEIRFI